MYLCASILPRNNMNEHNRNILFPIGNFSYQSLGVFSCAEKYSTNNLFFSCFCVNKHTQPRASDIQFLFHYEAYTTRIFTYFSCIAMEKLRETSTYAVKARRTPSIQIQWDGWLIYTQGFTGLKINLMFNNLIF